MLAYGLFDRLGYESLVNEMMLVVAASSCLIMPHACDIS